MWFSLELAKHSEYISGVQLLRGTYDVYNQLILLSLLLPAEG